MARLQPKGKRGNSSQKLSDVFGQYIRYKKLRGLTEYSLKNYNRTYNKFSAYAGDSITTNEITINLFDEWLLSMQEENLSVSSINTYLRGMRTFIYWCMDKERQYIKPPFKIGLIKESEHFPKSYDEEDKELLIKKPDRTVKSFNEWRGWAMSNFVLGTGARVGTMADIQLQDLDLKDGTVYYKHIKTRKAQHVNIPPRLVRVLEEYIEEWRTENTGPQDYLFCDADGNKATAELLSQGFYRYAKARGAKKATIHGLRHTFARDWILSGGDISVLQQQLGHSNIEMSAHYASMYATMSKDLFLAHNPLENMHSNGGGRGKLKKRN